MALTVPHVDAGKALSKTTKPTAPQQAHHAASFESHFRAQVAKAAKPTPEKSGHGQTAEEKLSAHKNDASAHAQHAVKSKALTDAAPAKTPHKTEPKEKKALTDDEASLASWAHHSLPQAPQEAPKAAKDASAATAAAQAADKDRAVKPQVSPKAANDKPAAEKSSNAVDGTRFDTLVKTEVKKADKDAAPKVTVVDKRTEKDKAKKTEADAAPLVPTPAVEQLAVAKNTETKPVNDVQAVFQTVTGKPQDHFETQAKATPVAPKDAAAFQQFLVEKGYGQLVEQARIILKNDNQGEIRMTLYPETLGKIKVSLNLSDSHLAGEIFVENQTVKEILQDNMGQLLQSFREGGFGDMNIQVSVGDGGRQSQDAQDRQGGIQAVSYGKNVAQTSLDAPAAARISSWSDRQVNLTA